MPKTSLKIDRFEGGLNNYVSPRDIEDNQSPNLSNVNIDTIGQIKLSGGATNYIEEVDKIEIKEDGWGLFFFRSDYDIVNEEGLKGGTYLHGSDTIGKNVYSNLGSETSVNVIAKLFDPVDTNTGSKAGIALRESQSEQWTALTNVLPLYENEDYIKAPVHSNFVSKNNSIRIWDSNFKQFGMTNKWFGVVKKTKFIGKDNVNYDSTDTPSWNKESAWLYTHAECKAPASIQAELFNRIQDTNWQDNTIKTTESGGSDSSITTIDVADASEFQKGDIILINDELIFIESISLNQLTVVRAVYGSTATSHSNGDNVRLVWRNSTSNQVYSPFNYGYYPSLNEQNLSHKDYNCQVIALDFTESDDADNMYETTTPGEPAGDFTGETNASDSTYGWGLATDGINNWSQEFDGIQFMYEFVEQTDQDELAWLDGFKYRFYVSLLYDGDTDSDFQESSLVDITPLNSNILAKKAKLYCNLSIKWTGMNDDAGQRTTTDYLANTESTTTATERNKELYINPRVTGCKIYYSSSEDNDNQKFVLLTASFDENNGIKRDGGSYMPWCPVNYGNASSVLKSHYRVSSKSDDTEVNINNSHRIDLSTVRNSGNAWLFNSPPSGTTYEGGDITNVLYKCSTEINGVRYVGNVCYPVNWDETKSEVQDASFEDLTRGTKYGDRIIVSPARQYDILNPENYLDVAINDGDEIVHLESLGSYLLQYKKDVLYILNVNTDQIAPVVAGTYKFKGVEKPYHVVKTDKEVFWINELGAYIFNGETVQNVSQYKLDSKIIRSLFADAISKPIVGYDIVERTVYIHSPEKYILSYHIDNQAWCKLKESFPVTGKFSNFANDENGNLVFSVFNSEIDGSNVNGLYFYKDDYDNGGKHYLGTSSTSPTDINGESFTFSSFAFSVGRILNVKNTGLTSSYISDNGLNFKKFTFFDTSINTNISLFTDSVAGNSAPHIDINDILKINENVLYFNFDNTTYRIEGLEGYWQVTQVRPEAPFIIDEIPTEERTPDTEEDDDTIIQEGVNYPYSFKLTKRTDVGVGIHKENLKIYDDATGVDVTSAIINEIRNTASTIDDDTTVINFLNNAGNLTDLNWNTVFEKERRNITDGHLLNKNNYFDGNYRVKANLGTHLELSSAFGDGQVIQSQGGNIPNFSRLYYDLRSSNPLSNTPKVVVTNEDHYAYIPESNMQLLNRNPQSSSNFFVLTKDIDFGEASRNKRIYKLYITYTASSIANARVFVIVTTKKGVKLLFPDTSKCKNYGIIQNPEITDITVDSNLNPGEIESFFQSGGFLVDFGSDISNPFSSKVAEIQFDDPENYLKNALSIQVGICPSGFNLKHFDIETVSLINDPSSDMTAESYSFLEVPSNFSINDINIVYRGKNVK